MTTLIEKAKTLIPGGVNSPVRAFGSVGREPVFIASADGPYVFDIDGNRYIDYVGSWGPMILGHNHPDVREAVVKAAEKGMSFGACTEAEVALAEVLCDTVDSLEMVRLVNSGTEATMSAIRLARGATGRELIVKFRGCYHGHGDSFLIEAGSGALTHGQPSSPGVTKGTAKDTLLADFNDLSSVESLFEAHGKNIAGIIVEPIAGNMGVVPPVEGFLEGLRVLCDKNEAILIFDEVMTGFRVSLQGAQGLYGIQPDLSTFGKIIGGGLPVGAYGGRADLMSQVSPSGPVYQAGTLSGNPLATAAGLAVMRAIREPGFYEGLEEKARVWESGICKAFGDAGKTFALNRVATMQTLFFSDKPIYGYADATTSDTEAYGDWFRKMFEHGIYLAPSQFEAAFLSIAHSDEVLEATQEAVEASVR